MALKLFSRKQRRRALPGYQAAPHNVLHGDPLVKALQSKRFAAIVARPECWQDHLEFEPIYAQALRAIDDTLCLIPEGYATIPNSIDSEASDADQDYETETFLLARHAVTQADYQLFVDDGGYQDLELWPEDIWPHMIDFTDLTGAPGPRFWRNGRHNRKLTDHPVVGICSYEAGAYAAWIGCRLPTEIEWQMAASWRIRSAANTGRRYPWGDALDPKRCNIWASGHAGTLPVGACASGAAPNGVTQLIGNVWEWTSSEFTITDEQQRPVVGDTLLRSIRGGAFDTYFPWQATSEFRTGLTSLCRAHNVGFRCALDADVAAEPPPD